MYVTVTYHAHSALLTLPVTIAPLEIPPFLFPPTRQNALTRRFAGSASTRLREYRRAAAGAHSCHVDARVTRRSPRAWGVLARPRAASGEYGVLIGRESAPIANRRKIRSAVRAPNKAVRANQKFRGFYCQCVNFVRRREGTLTYFHFI